MPFRTTVLLACACFATTACSPRLKPEGIYTFSSSGVSEKLELQSSGAFTQTISDAGILYTNAGRWTLQNGTILSFGPFLVRFDTRSERMIAPTEYSLYSGRIEQSGALVVFDDEGKYYIGRQAP